MAILAGKILRRAAIFFLPLTAAICVCAQDITPPGARNGQAGAAASFPATAATSLSEVHLQVDAGRQTGPVPYAWRAGVFLCSMPGGYPKDMFLADQQPGMVEFGWEYYETLSAAKTEEEFFSRLPQSSFTEWVREVAKAGGEPYMNLMPVPIWLRSGKNGNRKLPRDWQGWERYVERMVDYFNNQLRIDARYIVWDEPNVSEAFRGTMEDYLLLYKHTAAGLLRANPKARIGGPAVSEFYAKLQAVKDNRPSPLLPAFVRYCANTPLSGQADRLPLDFLVWHTFDAAPVSPGRYDLEVKAARAILKENGYPENTELNIGSWSALDQFPELGTNVRDSEFLGAFVVASVIAMERSGVNRHVFFSLFEDWICAPGEFTNAEAGLITRNYIALQRDFSSRKFIQPSDGSLQDALTAKELRHGCQTDSAVAADVEHVL
ncbi:MAG: hypothetical protein HZA50_16720, partial [Planctomycetes bacterium]|nr:hypothetical protein [Planctomycetota bacterium]